MILGIQIEENVDIETKRRALIIALSKLQFDIGNEEDPEVIEFLKQPCLTITIHPGYVISPRTA